MRNSQDEKIVDCGCQVDIRIKDSYIEVYNSDTQLYDRLYPQFRLYQNDISTYTLKANDGRVLTLKAGCTVSIDGVDYEDFTEAINAVTELIVNFFFNINAAIAYAATNGTRFLDANNTIFGLGGNLIEDTFINGDGFILNLGNVNRISQFVVNAQIVSINSTVSATLQSDQNAQVTAGQNAIVKGRVSVQLQTPAIDALTAKNGWKFTLIDQLTGAGEWIRDPYQGELAASPINDANYTAQDGDWYYNTVAKEDVYYDGSRLKWLSKNDYIAHYSATGIIPSGLPFWFDGDTFTTSSTGKKRGIQIDRASTLVRSVFRKSLVGAASSTVRIYKNNNEAVALHDILSPNSLPLEVNEDLNIDLNDADILGVMNFSGGTLETPKGYLVIKRLY